MIKTVKSAVFEFRTGEVFTITKAIDGSFHISINDGNNGYDESFQIDGRDAKEFVEVVCGE